MCDSIELLARMAPLINNRLCGKDDVKSSISAQFTATMYNIAVYCYQQIVDLPYPFKRFESVALNIVTDLFIILEITDASNGVLSCVTVLSQLSVIEAVSVIKVVDPLSHNMLTSSNTRFQYENL